MSGDEVLQSADGRMHKAADILKHELASVRTGRANPGLIEHIQVEYHGVQMPLNQIAGISAPDPRMLVIQPWDKTVLPNIEKAILKSDLGLNPGNDGNIIRLPIPQLTEERRNQLVKMVRKRVEEGKVAVRNVRRDAIDGLRKLKDDKELSEDEQKRLMTRLQQVTDKHIEEIDRIAKTKETELLEF